ncbi:hypothetical protein Aglo03_36470 [Actinokineospora globicatena]|uniref:Uncharacterized protein n=1 Tax=Actinokineospora globicatena TaxID=103729 RepID=A0A9W6QMM3_9PSEU|nr:hypothetical protein Aglo03_36470 [Actinokineospora globicatena]
MEWLTVRVGGVRIAYFPAGAAVDLSRVCHCWPEVMAADQYFANHPDVRRILWRPRKPDWKVGPAGWLNKPKSYGFHYGLLHWADGADLADLDSRVRSHTVRPDDFAACVAAIAISIECLRCHAHITVASTAAGEGPPWAANVERINEHVFYRECPACGQGERWPLVVDFVDPRSWPQGWHVRSPPR